jgi:hypothetical protein
MEIVVLLLPFLVFLKLPFSLFCLSLQFIHLIDEGSGTFLFNSKLSRSILSAEFSILVEPVWIPAFFKKRLLLFSWEEALPC